MEQIELQATKREILGKKVRFLRRQGIIPANLFGHNVDSMAVQCDGAKLRRVLTQAGKTRLVTLKLDEEEKPRNVMIRDIQKNPLNGELLHVDLYQVTMAEKIKIEIPIVLIGEAPALKSKSNMLLQELNRLTIECFPNQIPDQIGVNLAALTEVDQAIRVKDIMLGEGITILTNPEQAVARIISRPVEKMEEVKEVVAEEVVKAPEAESKEE